MLEHLDAVPGLARIRLGSLEPGLLTSGFLERAAKIGRLCPHFHVSLQSGSDSVLARMNRPYTSRQYAEVIANIRRAFDRPALTTDVITGFPGETEEEFMETAAFLREIRFSRLHVFPYSERAGTAAAALPAKVAKDVKKERTGLLIALGKEYERAFISGFLGERDDVLFERFVDGGLAEGHTGRYNLVRADGTPGEISSVLLKSQKNDIIYGEVVKGG
ncbi:tRNA-2-methylthio-N(6)-dimethylallyladenosine synthase [bioreactor metagenome]|uniref:tRNA-2-methylthio-N(6)-dimethylallyladenosine synthase n=1 Tax=bioreactor metagenome TaxID=1076179 RepID=A0A645DTK9_9ZZZZ